MADNMMRIAGRDENGLAKAVSVLTDPNGKGVLRVFDAAPHNQDVSADALKTIGVARTKLTTIFSGTVAPNTLKIDGLRFQCSNETEIWVYVNTNKQPWQLFGGTVYLPGGYSLKPFYPDISADQTLEYPFSHPKIALWLGQNHSIGMPVPVSMADAKAWSIPPGNTNIGFRYMNKHATEEATVMIQILSVWR